MGLPLVERGLFGKIADQAGLLCQNVCIIPTTGFRPMPAGNKVGALTCTLQKPAGCCRKSRWQRALWKQRELLDIRW